MIWVFALLGPAAADEGCPACQLQMHAEWSHEPPELVGPDDETVVLTVTEGDKPTLTPDDGELQVTKLTQELESQGLAVQEPVHRLVTSPLGEPMILIEFGLSSTEEGKDPPAERGARLVRRCGSTATFDLFAVPAEPKTLTRAATQLIWQKEACHRFNARPYRRASAEVAAEIDPDEALPPAIRDPTPKEEGREGFPLSYLLGFIGVSGALIGFAVWQNKRTRAPRLVKVQPPGSEIDPPAFDPLMNPVDDAKQKPVKKQKFAPAPSTEGERRAAVDEAVSTVYDATDETGEADPKLSRAVLALGRVVPATAPRQPLRQVSGVPEAYEALLAHCDGGEWGDGWLRLFGAGPGADPEVRGFNRRLSRNLGGRFAIGCGGFGILLAVEKSGRVVACEPYFGSVVGLGESLTEMFEALARDEGVRGQVCDRQRLQTYIDKGEALAPGMVFDPGSKDPEQVSLLDLWMRASPLP